MVSECDRIAKVLREHATTIGGCCLCSFNCAPNTNDTHAEHVAAAVLDALELTVQVRGPFVHGYEQRLVGPWVRVGEETKP